MLPAFQDRDLLIHWEAAPGTSLPEMNRITTLVSQELERFPACATSAPTSGAPSPRISRPVSTPASSGSAWTQLPTTPRPSPPSSDVVDGYPGLYQDVLTYPEQRIRDVLTGQPTPWSLASTARTTRCSAPKAEKSASVIAGIDGVVDPHVSAPVEEPTLEIEVDLAKAQAAGIKPGDVRRAAAALLSGIEVGNLFEEQKVFEVVVWGAPETRHSLTSIQIC